MKGGRREGEGKTAQITVCVSIGRHEPLNEVEMQQHKQILDAAAISSGKHILHNSLEGCEEHWRCPVISECGLRRSVTAVSHSN